MTLQDAKEFLENSHYEGLYDFLVFFFSPLANTIEVREGHFREYSEGKMWFDDIWHKYNKMQIPYCGYINGAFECGQGDIETGKWK